MANWVEDYRKRYPCCKKYDDNGGSVGMGCGCNHCNKGIKSYYEYLDKNNLDR